MPVKGKQKGNSYEILVSRQLSKFLTEGNRDDLFWRSSNSGGRQTVRAKKGIDTHNQAGDICNTHPDGELFMEVFVLECKHYRDINLWSLFTETKGNTIMGWWDVHLEKSKEVKKHPILIIRQNHKPDLFICSKKLAIPIAKQCKIKPILIKNYLKEDMYIYKFESILNLELKKFNRMLKGMNK